jgi:hypothetical protein
LQVLDSTSEKIEEATKLKEEGNAEFKAQNFEKALAAYQKVFKN